MQKPRDSASRSVSPDSIEIEPDAGIDARVGVGQGVGEREMRHFDEEGDGEGKEDVTEGISRGWEDGNMIKTEWGVRDPGPDAAPGWLDRNESDAYVGAGGRLPPLRESSSIRSRASEDTIGAQ